MLNQLQCERAFEALAAEVNIEGISASRLRECARQLESLVLDGYLEASGLIAELYATEPAIYDPGKAYLYYHLSFRNEGLDTRFDNLYEGSNQYLGAVGDFRNETPVAELIEVLGITRIKALDAKAMAWFTQHRP